MSRGAIPVPPLNRISRASDSRETIQNRLDLIRLVLDQLVPGDDVPEALDLRAQVVHVGVGLRRAAVADRHDRNADGADLRGGNLPVQVRAQFDVGVAHACVTDRLGEQHGQPAACGAAVAVWREPGSSSDLAADPGE